MTSPRSPWLTYIRLRLKLDSAVAVERTLLPDAVPQVPVDDCNRVIAGDTLFPIRAKQTRWLSNRLRLKRMCHFCTSMAIRDRRYSPCHLPSDRVLFFILLWAHQVWQVPSTHITEKPINEIRTWQIAPAYNTTNNFLQLNLSLLSIRVFFVN